MIASPVTLSRFICVVAVALFFSPADRLAHAQTTGTPAAKTNSKDIAMTTTATIKVTAAKTRISPDLFGIFFEDLNYAADGGLYAELIQNRSFEYQATEQPTWNSLSFWEFTERGGAKGMWAVSDSSPVHPNNPHCVQVRSSKTGDGVGLMNPGFDGIPVKSGETYDVSFFARQNYMNQAWAADSGLEGRPMPVVVRLESLDGTVLAEAPLQIAGREWSRFAATLVPNRTDPKARFVLLLKANGMIALDEISLFPRSTFRDRRNGLRSDLAQTVADLKPRFIRFPGGCLAHGDGVSNFYRWKDTIGPIEQRKGQRNIWGYHQSVGLGYYEYFQYCEDIGAKPLPVVPAGVSCQNSDHTPGLGQQCVPIADMPAYIQDLLDLVEWANGPVTSKWGAKRAEAGHPLPFGLEYLGVGNEDHITSGFQERFKMIFDAFKAQHPEITVIGTVGPNHSGSDYDAGWAFGRKLGVPIVDEHYYVAPDWFWDNLNFYDRYKRGTGEVYLGEYAAHDAGRRSTLRAALAEAAYMTALERNGDVVRLASYAPLLARRGHTQWTPDLIYFDNTTICLTPSYFVQKLFGQNAGDEYLQTSIETETSKVLAASTVRDSKSGDTIVKRVSRNDAPVRTTIDFSTLGIKAGPATCTVLAGDPNADNSFGKAPTIVPTTTTLSLEPKYELDLSPHSLTVIRVAPNP